MRSRSSRRNIGLITRNRAVQRATLFFCLLAHYLRYYPYTSHLLAVEDMAYGGTCIAHPYH